MEDMLRYIEKIVEPTIKDFEERPTSVRHAFLACVAAFHAIDYLAWPQTRPATLRQRFRQASPAFTRIDMIAHAFKHVSTSGSSGRGLKANEVISRPPAFFDVGVWDLSRWDDATGGVTIDHERSIDVLQELKATVVFLKSLSESGSPFVTLRQPKPRTLR